MGAAADCESIGVGLLGQPVNSITTLAFVAAGFWIVTRRSDRLWVGVAVVVTGIGSFLFHGPMPPGAEWGHDVTLAWLLLVVAGTGTRWEKATHVPGLLILGVLFGLFPAIADPIAVAITVIAVVVRIRLDRSAHTWGALSLLAGAAIIGRLGGAGRPLCDPDSILQTHGFWHVAAAVAVVWWATGTDSPNTPPITGIMCGLVEVARTLVGSIGLVAAVRLTTWLGSRAVVARREQKQLGPRTGATGMDR